MRDTTIARNYAEALLALARKAGALDAWGTAFSGVAVAVRDDERLWNFLAAPQISAAAKKAVIAKAFAGKLPRLMVLFLEKLFDNRRQLLIPQIAVEYGNLVDEAEGRLHAQVTVAREVEEADRQLIARELSRAFAKVVVPHIHVNAALIGGVVVRVGDRVMDGSVRRRLATLRHQVMRNA